MARGTEPEDRDVALPRRGADRYQSSHWGLPHRRKYRVSYIPGTLVEMGDLVELWVTDKGQTVELAMPPGCKLVFSTSLDERLYPIVPKAHWKWIRKHWVSPTGEWHPIGDVARSVGGRQAKYRHNPAPEVQALGRVTHAIYRTRKAPDRNQVEYIHAMGEHGGRSPMLTVDRDGRLWFAGGSYHVPDEGITR